MRTPIGVIAPKDLTPFQYFLAVVMAIQVMSELARKQQSFTKSSQQEQFEPGLPDTSKKRDHNQMRHCGTSGTQEQSTLPVYQKVPFEPSSKNDLDFKTLISIYGVYIESLRQISVEIKEFIQQPSKEASVLQPEHSSFCEAGQNKRLVDCRGQHILLSEIQKDIPECVRQRLDSKPNIYQSYTFAGSGQRQLNPLPVVFDGNGFQVHQVEPT